MIEEKISAIGFTIIIFFLLFIEKIRINRVITPYSVMALPFVVIILLTNFLLTEIKFPMISIRVQFFLLLQLIILWFIGYIISEILFKNKDIIFQHSSLFAEEFKDYSLFIIIVAWISIIIVWMKINYLFSIHGGWTYFGDPQYEKQLMNGYEAHVLQISKVCLLYLIFIYRSAKFRKIIFITIIGLFITIAAIQVKYHILWIVLMIFFYFNLEKPVKIQIKNLILSAIAIIFIFNLFWFVLTVAWGTFGFSEEGIWLFYARQTANYLVTGPINLDMWLQNANVRPDWILITVFKNLSNMIIGDPVRYNFVPLVSLGFTQILPGYYSNIGTSFGTFFLIGGWPLTIGVTFFTSIISYTVYFLTYKKYRFYLVFFNLLFLTLGTLAFFGQYYTVFSTYEMPFIFLIFGFAFKILNYCKRLLEINSNR